jgi:hypothetical protein
VIDTVWSKLQANTLDKIVVGCGIFQSPENNGFYNIGFALAVSAVVKNTPAACPREEVQNSEVIRFSQYVSPLGKGSVTIIGSEDIAGRVNCRQTE